MIYTSLKNNIYYDSNADVLNYKIVEDGGAVIYFGSSIKNPKSGLNRINVGEIIRDYLTNNLEEGWPALSGSSINQTEAYKKFSLISGELVMETYGVIFNWTDLFDGSDMVLSEPINGKMEPRMKLFWTAFLEEGKLLPINDEPFSLTISGETNFTYSAQTSVLSVVECSDWNGIEIQTDSDWFTATKTSTGITLSINENINLSARTGTINYLYSGFSVYSTIIKQSDYFILVISGNTEFEYNAQSSELYVVECNDWESVSVISDSGWLTPSKNSTGVTITITENDLDSQRIGHLKFYRSGDIVETIEITQKINYSNMYFTTRALENGTIVFVAGQPGTITSGRSLEMYYRINNGEWLSGLTGYHSYGVIMGIRVNVSSGDVIEWRSKKVGVQTRVNIFGSTGQYEVYGNIMSLAFGNSYKQYNSLRYGSTDILFEYMFWRSSKLVSAEHLVLPATEITAFCYTHMFEGCTNLVYPPKVLPSLTARTQSYEYMFSGCTYLTTAPELPATTLLKGCYAYMFEGCTSLVEAPELPAANLEENCYWFMFDKCTSLNYVKCMAETNISWDYSVTSWLRNVAANGTFVKKRGITWPSGCIPSGWTVQEADN